MTDRVDLSFAADPDVGAVVVALGNARFVGGCVRDALIGRTALDIDVATPLPPEAAVEKLTRAGIKVKPTGIDHGTVTAISGRRVIEVTTLRRDVETDGRHAKVAFTDDWHADAARRDLTINAIYADAEGRLFDPVGGVADLKAGRIRFIGDARQRIREDYLRVLRFFRFFAWYGRELDEAGLDACIAEQQGLERLSAERLRNETLKLLAAPDPAPTLLLMARHGILQHVLPGPYEFESVRALETEDPLRRLAALGASVERLRLSNRERDRLAMMGEKLGDIDRALYRDGAESVIDRLHLERPKDWREQVARAETYRRPKFPLDGRDALALGLSGKAVGAALADTEKVWIDSGFRLGREDLLKRLSSFSA